MTPTSSAAGGAPVPVEPGPDSGSALAAGLLALVTAAGGCATAPGPGAGPAGSPKGGDPGDDRPRAGVRDAGAAALEDVARLTAAGRYHAAALRADSLYFEARARSGLAATAAEALAREARALRLDGRLAEAAARLRELLRVYPSRADEDVPVRLARLQISLADDPAAASTLLARAGDAGGEGLELARRAGASMSIGELEGVLDGRLEAGPGGGDDPVRAALLAELAVARARSGRGREARAAARRALEAGPRDRDARRARSVLDGGTPAADGPVRIGLLLPRTGRLADIGDRILEGVELALAAHHGDDLPPVELSTADTGAEGASVADLVADLEADGVAAIIGPVRAGALGRAAAARADSGRLLVSPTASRIEAAAPRAFTLWDRRRRELAAARRLGGWLADALGSAPVGAVYPGSGTGRRSYLEFRAALARGRAWLAAAHPYEPGTTTLEGPISAVSAFRPRAVFAPGGRRTSVLQMAPQLSYYGVRGALVAGGFQWTRPATLRRLEPSLSQRRVLASFVARDDTSSAWSRFKASYEKKYRKTLYGNMLPALGHDAALMVLRALSGVHPTRPRAVARRAASLGPVEGATGQFRPDPRDGTVERAVRVRVLQDRALRPASPEDARAWLREAGGFETVRVRTRRRRARAAVRSSGIPLSPRGTGSAGDGGR